jgi:hypothetical protein
MITIRRSAERGQANYGWLDTKHTFSFNTYYDPKHVHFRTLRVINDDIVQGGQGFDTHPHKDMEILTWVLDGALEHKDSTGGGGIVRPGEIQYMSAGRGIFHSEYNASPTEPVRLIQIWIFPDKKGIAPSYGQKSFAAEQLSGKLLEVAGPNPPEGSARINQDARLLIGRFTPGESARLDLAEGRGAWVQVAKGRIELNGQTLEEGDGAAIESEKALDLKALANAEVMVFDLA